MSKRSAATEERDDPHRQILPVLTEDTEEIFKWLCGLFEISPRDAEPGKVKKGLDIMPERVVLQAIYGKDGRERGEPMEFKEWRAKSGPLPTAEALVELASKFYERAQQHCSNLEKRQKYQLSAFNNLKGPRAFSFHMFTCFPGPREFSKEGAAQLASDDDDKHADRQRRDDMAHIRWKEEQLMEALSGTLTLQQQMIKQGMDREKQLMEHIRLQDVERRQMIVAVEAAESKQMERKILLGWAQLKQGVVKDGVDLVKGYLPAVVAYATKGKVGIVEGLKRLMDELTPEQRVLLLGAWDAEKEPPVLQQLGILSPEQVFLILAILGGEAPPTKAADLVMSMTQEQLGKIQSTKLKDGSPLLNPKQMNAFMALAKAASEAGQ